MTEPSSQPAEARFPLFESGPFTRLQAPLRLTGTEKRQVRRRVISAVLASWVPLVVLAAVQGRAFGPNWRQSMLLDVGMMARYLVALPLLILATPGVRRSLQAVVLHFLEAKLVREQDRPLFFANITSILKWRDSAAAAVVIAALAVVIAVTVGTLAVAGMPESWRVLGTPGHRSLSLAGWWQIAVSDPLYDIVVLQFLYRLALLWRFLWKTSRLDLQLNAGHPDGAGGLAFLSMILPAFRLQIFAFAAASAGALANIMLRLGAPFASFQYSIGAFAAVLVAMIAGPLVFFSDQLRREKRRAVLSCGALANRQLRAFEKKWLGASPPEAEELLLAPDFSAVCDYTLTVTVIRRMNTLPFWPRQLVPLAAAALLPFLPVAAIEIPLKEIALQMLKLVK